MALYPPPPPLMNIFSVSCSLTLFRLVSFPWWGRGRGDNQFISHPKAAVKAEQWPLASKLFEDIERRHLSAASSCRGSGGIEENVGDDGEVNGADTNGADRHVGEDGGAEACKVPPAAPSNKSLPRPYDRGLREMRKTAIDAMAPTALTYRLALQVGRVGGPIGWGQSAGANTVLAVSPTISLLHSTEEGCGGSVCGTRRLGSLCFQVDGLGFSRKA